MIHGATDKFAPAGFAPIAIGLALTLIHLISIPVTNTSVNPARSTAVAIFQGGWALEQLWFFWVVPIVGGIIGGLIYRTLLEKSQRKFADQHHATICLIFVALDRQPTATCILMACAYCAEAVT